MESKKFDVVVVGGGSAGITAAARLRNAESSLKIAIVEPSDKHYYQPLWTLVGGGEVSFEFTERSEESVIPHGVEWIKDAATAFEPEKNLVRTKAGVSLEYRYLIVAPGIQIDWEKIKGLKETLGKNSVVSNYSKDHVSKTWDFLRDFNGGNAIFTFPNTPIKCAGAPQKIMYLAEHYMRKQGLRDKSRVIFASAGARIFGVQKYANALNRIVEERGIQTQFNHNLVSVDGAKKVAVFDHSETGKQVEMKFDFLHVAPPMSAPDFIKSSPLANEAGWVDVDKATTRHVKYSNVFSLGDASSLPTSKTGAAIRKQAPVLVSHLIADLKGTQSFQSYNGYTSCPLVTGYGRLILAEFDYDGNPAETFPIDQSKERYSMYLLKKHGLPFLYWNGMLKGRA